MMECSIIEKSTRQKIRLNIKASKQIQFCMQSAIGEQTVPSFSTPHLNQLYFAFINLRI